MRFLIYDIKHTRCTKFSRFRKYQLIKFANLLPTNGYSFDFENPYFVILAYIFDNAIRRLADIINKDYFLFLLYFSSCAIRSGGNEPTMFGPTDIVFFSKVCAKSNMLSSISIPSFIYDIY